MSLQAFIEALTQRGVKLTVSERLVVDAPIGLLAPDEVERLREHKAELLAYLHATVPQRQPTRDVIPDSRHPLVAPEVRRKIEAIEAEARAKGWPAELLWNGGYWDRPRGLAALLDADDEISEVTPDHIGILKTRRDLLKFQRHTA